MPTKPRRHPSRTPMVRCVRATIQGRRGWRVTWLDYERDAWRQNAFFTSEAEARALVKKLKERGAGKKNDG
jgi:hypothetical protein